MRLASFILLSALAGGAGADEPRVNLFEKFNTYCIEPGPDFDRISESLSADGALRLPDQAGVDPDDPAKISGFMFPGTPAISFMISKSGKCATVSNSVDTEATKASLGEMLEVWKGRAKVEELPLEPGKGQLAAYRIDFSHGMMTITLFTDPNDKSSGSVFLSREIYTK